MRRGKADAIFRSIAICFLCALLLAGRTPGASARAEQGTFTDTRFRGDYSTENLDAIIEEYELHDGWYWSTQPGVYQDYHGQESKKGWTQTSEERFDPIVYTWGWYGCRWNWDAVDQADPNRTGWGECFGFCQFLGYLLSGERNPHRNWPAFHSVRQAGGLKPGDIVRVDYTDEKGAHQHSAVVYSMDEESGTVLFLQASGSNYNQLYTRRGFIGAGLGGSTDLTDIVECPGLLILRAEENLQGNYPKDWVPER